MNDASGTQRSLPSIRVDVVEPGVRIRRDWDGCVIGQNLKFDTTGLEAYCLASWEPIIYDAFVVAAAVEFCDHTKARPSTGWSRDIALRVPVHDPVHWNSSSVLESLHGALTFLTGDRWTITFTSRKTIVPNPHQGRFSMPDGSCLVIPFSDGLDSLTVARLMERVHGDQLIPVRLGSKSFNRARHRSLPRPFASVPYHVRAGEKRFVETSARSRGFKFALLSGIAAYLSGAGQVIVPESGQGVLGPYLVPVGQAYEDYRNHPLFTVRMESFLFALFHHPVRFTFPRIWHTKGETLAEFVADDLGSPQWSETRSCWQSNRHVSVSHRRRQCGVCAACLLRRLSVHAIGSEENKETYVWDNLSASHFEDGAALAFNIRKPKGALYEYAIAGVLHLDHLANLRCSAPNRAPLNRKVFQLSRCLGIPEAEIQGKLVRLLKQHEGEWKRFVHSLGPDSFVAKWALRAR